MKHDIPFYKPFLSALADSIVCNTTKNVVAIFPHEYAASLFMQKTNIPSLTYDNIGEKINYFIIDQNIHITLPPAISNTELKLHIYDTLLETQLTSLNKLENLYSEVLEYYYNPTTIKDIQATNPVLHKLIEALEGILRQRGYITKPIQNILALQKLHTVSKNNICKIYCTIPIGSTPNTYIQTCLELINNLQNGSQIIPQKAAVHSPYQHNVSTSKRAHEVPVLANLENIEIFKASSTTQEALFIAHYVKNHISSNPQDTIGIIVGDSKLSRAIHSALTVSHSINLSKLQHPSHMPNNIRLFYMIALYLADSAQNVELFLDIIKHPLSSIQQEIISSLEAKLYTNGRYRNEIISYLMEQEENKYFPLKSLLITLDGYRNKYRIPTPFYKILETNCTLYNTASIKSPLGTWTSLLQSTIPITATQYANSIKHLLPLIINNYTDKNDKKSTGNIYVLNPKDATMLNFTLCIFSGLAERAPLTYSQFNHFFTDSIEESIYNTVLSLSTQITPKPKMLLTYTCNNSIGNRPVQWLEQLTLRKEYINSRSPYKLSYKEKEPTKKLTDNKDNATLYRVEQQHKPLSLSVSAIELLMRDPYAYYVKYILQLQPVEYKPSQTMKKEFGLILHNVLHNAIQLDITIGRTKYIQKFMDLYFYNIRSLQIAPALKFSWDSKFYSIANWFFEYECSIASQRIATYTEIHGTMHLQIHNQELTIKARFDRVDLLHGGTVKIIDYKGSNIPTNKEVNTGTAPQLPIEGLIILHGKLETPLQHLLKIAPSKERNLLYSYILLKGTIFGNRECPIHIDLAKAKAGLISLLELFWHEDGFLLPSTR